MKCKDWCPMCGSRFEADNYNELGILIIDHLDSGYCKANQKPFLIALHDDSFEKCDTGTRYQSKGATR